MHWNVERGVGLSRMAACGLCVAAGHGVLLPGASEPVYLVPRFMTEVGISIHVDGSINSKSQ